MIVIENFEPGGSRDCALRIARRLLGVDLTIERLDTGAPYIVGREDNHISISHTANYLAFMLSDKPCGVDIEFADRVVSKVERRFASQAEKEVCAGVFPTNASLLVWCVKEAVYKLLRREGVDFLRDMVVCRCENNMVFVSAFSEEIRLRWELVEGDTLLMVYTV